MAHRLRGGARPTTLLATLLAISLILASCGGTSSDDSGGGGGGSTEELGLTAQDGESGLEEAGDPVRGGTLRYGLEADSTGGFCLTEGQLAISGMMVVRAVYDTLTVPNGEGGYSPYLAKAVTPNEDHTVWDIELREGIKFHDGTDLTAEVVKNNLDAYRGEPGDHNRSSLLLMFVFSNVDTVEVTGPLTVQVTMHEPWVAFPAYLYASSRVGIMAQSQLDDTENCHNDLVGTGPFKFSSWDPNVRFVAERNEDYWQIAPDGEPYPYADRLEFVPIPDAQVRNNAIEGGDVNIMHTSNSENISRELRDLRERGEVNMFVSEEAGEVSFVQLNTARPPFDDVRMRRALAMAADMDEINNSLNAGLPTLASGPFGPDSIGYVEDSGYPSYDLEQAQDLIDEYVAEGGSPEFNIRATNDAGVIRLAEMVQQRAKAVGVDVTISQSDQPQLIEAAIGGDFQAMTFRNYPGGDPDQLYVWFHSGNADGPGEVATNPVNFSKTNDPEVDRLLDEGRAEADEDARAEIYQDLQRRMGSEVYGIWGWYTPWAIVMAPNVHGVIGPPLPGEDHTQPAEESTDDPARQPSIGLATGHSLLGLWVTE